MSMASDDTSTTPVTLRKCTISHKHRIHRDLTDDFRINRTLTARNQSPSKSSNANAKASIPSLTPQPVQFKRCRSQQRDLITASPSKLERQTTNVNFQMRLPTFHTIANENDQKRTSDFRRRQIYALNHLMCNLEQEQFRQFCKLHSIGIDNNEDTHKESLT